MDLHETRDKRGLDAGFTPLLCFQGSHDHLLETMLEVAKGKTIAWFDKTDLSKARKVIGKLACIAGGISPSFLIGGTPKSRGTRKKIMEYLKPGGGFIFTLPFNLQ